ncbi:unnamed protein product [Moneuplotes crassus]|uniref:Uncharacterized protein n=1 Tax=Euplotes crassus TaxID=5936 RepID=A0AAD1XLB9_EUPCR|nr:unnamed protein product [Moneuplotes crassus]
MSDDEFEGEGVEGEEDEEGGESEKEVEEVKEPPKIPIYVPKIDPLTQVLNINRNLDMLNSEVNVISSEFMVMTSAMGNKPKFYNVSPTRNFSSPNYNTVGGAYSSPIRHNAGSATYWNNPNHITLSPPKYNPPVYSNTTSSYQAPSIYKPSNYAHSPIRKAYSPSRYNAPNYSGVPCIASKTLQSPSNDYNMRKLFNDIDNVLNNQIPSAPPPPPLIMKEEVYNTFDRAHQPEMLPNHEIITYQEPQRVIVDEPRPPLYDRREIYSKYNQVTKADDLYNRKPEPERYNLVQSVHSNPRSRSPLRNVQRTQSPHFQRPRSEARRVPAPASDFQIHDAVKTLFR